jgi:hypothetical protein
MIGAVPTASPGSSTARPTTWTNHDAPVLKHRADLYMYSFCTVCRSELQVQLHGRIAPLQTFDTVALGWVGYSRPGGTVSRRCFMVGKCFEFPRRVHIWSRAVLFGPVATGCESGTISDCSRPSDDGWRGRLALACDWPSRPWGEFPLHSPAS